MLGVGEGWVGMENLPLRNFNLTDLIQQVFVDGLLCARLMPDWPCKHEEGIGSPCSESLDLVGLDTHMWECASTEQEWGREDWGCPRTREVHAKSWRKNGCLLGAGCRGCYCPAESASRAISVDDQRPPAPLHCKLILCKVQWNSLGRTMKKITALSF